MGAKPKGAVSPTGEQRRHECRVEGEEPGRADRYIAEVLGILSRSQIKARGALIEVEGRPAKLSRLLKAGERLVVSWREEPSPGLVAENLPLDILYEDERVWVLNKAQGMVTHPGAGNRRGTLANALLGRLAAAHREEAGRDPPPPDSVARGAEAPGPALRGGIVHRLDKDTSGLIIAAKDAEAQAFLAAQFKDRRAKKEYLAITKGIPEPREGRIENRLGRDRRDRKRFAAVEEGGRVAVTDYRVLASFAGGGYAGGGRGSYALVSLRPRTGRTHQLRVHLAALGCPILGDPIYGRTDPRFPAASLMLHAYRLRILLPGREEASLFKAPLPARFSLLLAELEARP